MTHVCVQDTVSKTHIKHIQYSHHVTEVSDSQDKFHIPSIVTTKAGSPWVWYLYMHRVTRVWSIENDFTSSCVGKYVCLDHSEPYNLFMFHEGPKISPKTICNSRQKWGNFSVSAVNPTKDHPLPWPILATFHKFSGLLLCHMVYIWVQNTFIHISKQYH